MAEIKIDVSALARLAEKFESRERVLEAVRDGMQVGLVRTANYIANSKLQGNPLHQRSGRLIESVLAVDPPDIQGTEVVGHIKSAFYGGVQERGATIEVNSAVDLGGDIGWRYLGTVTIPARPWMKPGIEEMKTTIQEEIARAIVESLRERS